MKKSWTRIAAGVGTALTVGLLPGTNAFAHCPTSVTKVTPTVVLPAQATSYLSNYEKAIVINKSSGVPTTSVGLFSLEYSATGALPQPAYEWTTTSAQSEVGTLGFDDIETMRTSRASGEDQLWGIQYDTGLTSAQVYKNVFTTSGGSVVFGSWVAVDPVPGPLLPRAAFAAGVDHLAQNRVFAQSSAPGFTDTVCMSNADCGAQEICFDGSCSCPDHAYLYQLNITDSHWVPVQGHTSNTQHANACVSSMAMDQDTNSSTYGHLLVIAPTPSGSSTSGFTFWSLATQGTVGQSSGAWTSVNASLPPNIGNVAATAFDGQLVMQDTSPGGNFDYYAGSNVFTVATPTTGGPITCALALGGTGCETSDTSPDCCGDPYNTSFDPDTGDLYWSSGSFGTGGKMALCKWTACDLYHACVNMGGSSCPNPAGC